MMNITRAPINIHERLWWMQLHVRSAAFAPLRALRCVRSAARPVSGKLVSATM